MPNIKRFIFIAIIPLLLTGCSSTTLTASWKNPEYNRYLENIYIVGVSKENITRRLYEDSFKQELDKMGVNGIVSYKDVSQKEDNKDKIMEMALANRADSILITRLVKKRTETVVEPGRVTTTYRTRYSPYDYPHYRSYNDFYTHRYETTYEPPRVSQYDIATIEANLYNTDSGELIWSAQLETVASGNLKKAVDDFIIVVMKDLKIKRLL